MSGQSKLRILVEIVHPADVLFFREPLKQWADRGVEISVVSRVKDLTQDLLDKHRIEHTVISKAGRGRVGLATELVFRTLRLWRIVRDFRPDVMVGFGGVAISHVGCLTGIPAVSFYDSEHAKLQIRLALPFVTEWHVPACWDGAHEHKRMRRFDGYKELAYLHPDVFYPSRELAIKNGLKNGVDNFFVRVVEFRASHDLGKKGMTVEGLRGLVAKLERRGRVIVSSETPLPDDLREFEYRGDIAEVHHLLSHCRLYVGESATMAAEAAVLGVPAVFTADFHLGYINEMVRLGMVTKAVGELSTILHAVDQALAVPSSAWCEARERMLGNKINVADYVVKSVLKMALREAGD